ncbi:hypothetical protein [Psychrobacter lutiphocae]|uniref:hypothetical protein n=1 Tax=Psychrobacter lutiphocae TaxID=540500 RepID=UPI00036438DA|nr:hypothetical protein [Psychrobacter lutiphocae]
MQKYDHNIPERAFMNALLKHTGIALLILIPLAAYSVASAQTIPVEQIQMLSEVEVSNIP